MAKEKFAPILFLRAGDGLSFLSPEKVFTQVSDEDKPLKIARYELLSVDTYKYEKKAVLQKGKL